MQNTQIQPLDSDEQPTFPTPLNEEERLQSLRNLNILDTEKEERFDRIVRIAANYFGTPMARLTFVDSDRTWYKSCVGVQASDGPRNTALCAHTIMGNDVLVSCNLAQDPRFYMSPQVARPGGLLFYAAAPITLRDGMRVGSLCVFDTKTRTHFSPADRQVLLDLAELVVRELELHDGITQRDRRLAVAEEQVSVSRNAKERFLRLVNHELKTPLNHILGLGTILAEQHLGPLGQADYVDFANNIRNAARHLEDLVDRVLAYSAAETGDLRLSETVVTPSALSAQACDFVAAAAQTAYVTVRCDVSADAPAAVFVDELQSVQAVVQLLNNAIAFSPKGGTVMLRVTKTEEGGLCLSVCDCGAGIDPERIQYAIQAFAQMDESLRRDHDGIGLGLAVTDALIRLHGGTLSIRNRSEGGTEAKIILPASRNRQPE